jgi:hypothetical protein
MSWLILIAVTGGACIAAGYMADWLRDRRNARRLAGDVRRPVLSDGEQAAFRLIERLYQCTEAEEPQRNGGAG